VALRGPRQVQPGVRALADRARPEALAELQEESLPGKRNLATGAIWVGWLTTAGSLLLIGLLLALGFSMF